MLLSEVSSSGMVFEADELLNLAIMTKTPVLLVEGVDDVSIYERLTDSVGVMIDIYASENVVTRKEGCVGVIENINEIRAVAGEIEVEKYVLGIIDHDARSFRREVPADPAIFVLDMYSIESHYVNPCSIRFLFSHTLKGYRLCTNELAERIFEKVKSKLMFLYVVSLEALRNACEPGYDAAYGYSDSIQSILNRELHVVAQGKEQELQAFGARLGLDASWGAILRVCKGKWILEMFASLLHEEIKLLPTACGCQAVPQCQSCASNENGKCLYKPKMFISSDILQKLAMTNSGAIPLGYIKERMAAMTIH